MSPAVAHDRRERDRLALAQRLSIRTRKALVHTWGPSPVSYSPRSCTSVIRLVLEVFPVLGMLEEIREQFEFPARLPKLVDVLLVERTVPAKVIDDVVDAIRRHLLLDVQMTYQEPPYRRLNGSLVVVGTFF